LVDCDDFSELLQSRWQEHSDQALELIGIDRKSVMTAQVPSLDVVLYPGNLLGTLTEKDWIASLPITLLERLGGGKKSNKANQEPTESTEQGIDSWSNRLRSIARYNGKWMALPLGAPCWVAATRGLNVDPLQRLQQAISSNQNSPELASEAFETFLRNAETTLQASLDTRQEQLDQVLKNSQAIDKRFLVNRFLWIMSSSESRFRGLIDPYKVTPRLGLPEFTRSARVLQRLALIEPSTILSSPVDAWERVAEGQAVFGLGWPRTDGIQRATDLSESKPLKLVPFLFNGGDGVLASIGRKTRQSSTAAEFMFWISREETRIALQSKSPRIEVLDIDDDRNRIREDYRDYQTLQRLESSNITLDMSPRFLNADPFMDSLADALMDILRNPNSAETRLDECKSQWTDLVNSTGLEFLRSSLERTTGLSN
jgi:hypothetical protein